MIELLLLQPTTFTRPRNIIPFLTLASLPFWLAKTQISLPSSHPLVVCSMPETNKAERGEVKEGVSDCDDTKIGGRNVRVGLPSPL